MQPRERRTIQTGQRRRGARALVRSRRRRDNSAWDVRALRLPDPLLTAPMALADPHPHLRVNVADPLVASREIDISDGPKLITRPDPAPPAGAAPAGAPPAGAPPAGAAPVRLPEDLSVRPTTDPGSIDVVAPPVIPPVVPSPAVPPVVPPPAEAIPPRRVSGAGRRPGRRPSPRVPGARNHLPDPVRFAADPPRTGEAVLAVVLWAIAIGVARSTTAPTVALVPLAAVPAAGLIALALPGATAARVLRAVCLLVAGAALAVISPDLSPVALVFAICTAAVYPSHLPTATGRAVTALAAASLAAPLLLRLQWLLPLEQPATRTMDALLLTGIPAVLLVGGSAIRIQRALARTIGVALARDRTARTATARLEQARTQDPVTGLETREALLRATTVALDVVQPRPRAASPQMPTRPLRHIGLLVIDIERFSTLADRHGSLIADDVAHEIARRLRAWAGGCGYRLARTGRSQFSLLDPDASAEKCAALAGEIAGLMAGPITSHGHELTVTGAIGAAISGSALRTADDLLQAADEASRAAQSSPTARWTLFDQAVRARAHTDSGLETELREAIRDGAVGVVFQPVLALGTGLVGDNGADDRIVGAEALPRWVRRDGTEVDPQRFLPLADELGFGARLRYQLIDAALDALVGWRHEGVGIDQVWIDADATQTQDPEFAGELIARLAARGLAPSSIVVEVQAGHLLETDQDLATLGLLRSFGIAIALDDFGAAGTSLSALRRLPVSAVKLDRVLTAELTRGGDVPRAVAQLCRGLGLRVVMQGVETLEQLHGARLVGADAAQGYAIARPLTAEDVTNLLTLRLPREFRL